MDRMELSPSIQQADRQPDTGTTHGLPGGSLAGGQPALDLIARLCQALRQAEIMYCHWKSNNALDRSASGENDLDLLVSRADASRFAEILHSLGFKLVRAPVEKQMTGVLDYFGYDQPTDRWVHVHAHYQLYMGHDMTKNFRLPVEDAYIRSAIWDGLFRIPAAEFEFIVFVIRMVLKHCTWDALLSREGTLKASERKELAYLQQRIDRSLVLEILRQHVPFIRTALFDSCVRALQTGSSTWSRVKTSQELLSALQANTLYSPPVDSFLKLWRRAVLMVRRRLLKSSSKYRPEIGGVTIAILGGDGAGKSTAVDALHAWLSRHLQTARIHMGKPTWSWTTTVLRSILKAGQLMGLYPLETTFEETLKQQSLVSPGYPFLLREICRARDRYRTYLKARRLAAHGSFVLLDRFPVPEIQLMDGPQVERFVRQLQATAEARRFLSPRLHHRLVKFLVKREQRYYDRITTPELMIVLRVDPEIAVRRKTSENAAAVRQRSTEVWNLNWEHTQAFVIDASRSEADVMTALKTLIWSRL